jgi:AcrR family transcriptional regulator
MTILRERIITAAYPLFLHGGANEISVDDIQRASGVTSEEFEQRFSSRDELAATCLTRRERQWTISALEAGVRARGTGPEARLLAVFDVLDDWFRRTDYAAGTFVNVLVELAQETPFAADSRTNRLSLSHLVHVLATEAALRDADAFVQSWNILADGTILSLLDDDPHAAARGKAMARDLIARHRPVLVAFPMDDVAHFWGTATGSFAEDPDVVINVDGFSRFDFGFSTDCSTDFSSDLGSDFGTDFGFAYDAD